VGVLEDLADGLARDAIAAARETGDERLIDEIAKQLAATSSTMEEAYMTSIRVRLSERRAREFLEQRLARARAAAGGDGG
jgi:hypothetical protein